MKKLGKILTSLVIVLSMALSMTGCAIKEVKETGDEIMNMAFNQKSKITKYLDEDDDDFDAQCIFIDELFDLMDDTLSLDYSDTEFKMNKVNVTKKSATIVYNVTIEDYDAEFEFDLVQDGDDWIIADNEQFIVALLDFVFQSAYEEGNKSDKEFIEDGLEYFDIKKPEKLADKTYYEYIREFG